MHMDTQAFGRALCRRNSYRTAVGATVGAARCSFAALNKMHDALAVGQRGDADLQRRKDGHVVGVDGMRLV